MNARFATPLMLFALACLFLFPAWAVAAESAAPFLQANVIYDFAADRTRMIQGALVIVALGCALMWWTK